MKVLDSVRKLVSMGPLPDSASATEQQLKDIEDALNSITPPVTRGEAEMLMACFGKGEDTCYGLAWALLHLIETAGEMLSAPPPPDANEWVRYMWTRIENARRLGKTK